MIPHLTSITGDVLATGTESRRLFFSLGNGEVQLAYLRAGHTVAELLTHVERCFRLGSLIFDFVLQPTAHYYLPVTREVAIRNMPLYRVGAAAFVLGHDVGDYREDYYQKLVEYPTHRNLLVTPQVVPNFIEELKSLSPNPIHHSGGTGRLTGENWARTVGLSKDLLCESLLSSERMSTARAESLVAFLEALPAFRGRRAFEWHYIRDQVTSAGWHVPPKVATYLYRLLLDCYTEACREVYSGYSVGEPSFKREGADQGRDLQRQVDVEGFFTLSDVVGLSHLLEDLTAADLAKIRVESEWINGFRSAYFCILGAANGSTVRAVDLVRSELSVERERQANCLRELISSSSSIIRETILDVGLPEFCGSFYRPSDEPMYRFKSTIVNLAEIPFSAFADELRFICSRKMEEKAGSLISAANRRFSFRNCTFLFSQIGEGKTNVILSIGADNKKEMPMTNFTFGGQCSFHGCQFGDNNSLQNFMSAIEPLSGTYPNGVEIVAMGAELRKGVEEDSSITPEAKMKIVQDLMELFKELSKSKQAEPSRIQQWWNEVKQGVQTSAHLTTIVMAFGKLLNLY